MIIVAVITGVISVLISSYVVFSTMNRVVDASDLKGLDYDYVIVLGAGYRDNYQPSPMLQDRLDTGLAAYQNLNSGKILLSADSMNPSDHDEIRVMREYLLKNGLGADEFEEDPYGISTYDSMWRAARLYKSKKVVIVTQKYHLYRALYIAEKMGMNPVGVASDLHDYGIKMVKYVIREVLARCKDVIWCIRQTPAVYPE